MSDTEFITEKQLMAYAKRIEKRNMQARGTSITFTGLARLANPFIVVLNENDIEIKKGWRQAISDGGDFLKPEEGK